MNALTDRLAVETEDWIVINIEAAITLIETGIAETSGLESTED